MKLFKNILTTAFTWVALTTFAAAQIVTGSYPNTFVNGTIIDATQVNADFNYVAAQVNANGAKNGSNSDITALTSLATPIPVVAGGSTEYIGTTVGGTGNAITVTVTTPAVSSYALALGYRVTFKVASANTGATTLAVGATAATNIFKQSIAGPTALTGSELTAGQFVTVWYDGTQYQLLNDMSQGFGFGPINNITAAATTDLGTKATRYVHVNGGGTITSFGSSASTTRPFYIINVNATTTLTSGANIVVPTGAASYILNSGDYALLEYLGTGAWQVITSWPANPRYGMAGASGLVFKSNAVTPATQVDITASEVIMDNPQGGQLYLDSYATCTVNMAVNGAAGLDTGAIAANTWYYFWMIANGTGGVSCLGSLSSSAPTMPAGYVYKFRVGAQRTRAAAATLWGFVQNGARSEITTGVFDNSIATGTTGTCTTVISLTTYAMSGWAPPTAKQFELTFGSPTGSGGNQCVASAVSGTSIAASGECLGVASATAAVRQRSVMLSNIDGNVYRCSNDAGATFSVTGWIDQVNAN